MSSPTQRTLNFFRKHGFLCAVVEKFNHHVRIRQDAYGWMDILAIRGNCTVGIQATTDTGGQMAKHIAKIKTVKAFETWPCESRRAFIIAWAKKGAKGKRKLYEFRIVELKNHPPTGVIEQLITEYDI